MFFSQYILTILFYLFLPVYFLERLFTGKSKGWKGKFGFCKQMNEDLIIIHGCSVGEINAVGSLVKKIKLQFPKYKVVLTTSTVTGQEVAKKKYSDIADYITYFPFDTVPETNRFLKRLNPKAVFILETEIWPCFANACSNRNIPLYIINGRISNDTIFSYKLFGFYFKKVLKKYKTIFTQSEEDSKKFISVIGSDENVKCMGNLKFDINANSDTKIDLAQEGYRVLIAGSTHKKENKIVINVYDRLKQEYADLKLIIAPRHLNRVADIEVLCKEHNLKYGKRSNNDNFKENDIIILDTLGELGKMYSACDLAYIGGSLNNTGGHNPLEAAVWNKPVISGDCVFNFKDIYSILQNCGAAKLVKNGNELYLVLKEILGSKELYNKMSSSCKTAFEKQKDAANFVLEVISKL